VSSIEEFGLRRNTQQAPARKARKRQLSSSLVSEIVEMSESVLVCGEGDMLVCPTDEVRLNDCLLVKMVEAARSSTLAQAS
jgi:hypothetical protein